MAIDQIANWIAALRSGDPEKAELACIEIEGATELVMEELACIEIRRSSRSGAMVELRRPLLKLCRDLQRKIDLQREALEQIASCQSFAPGDVVDIARNALKM
jgi:hypothetical protein